MVGDMRVLNAPVWRVVCLCAAWCGVCREYRAVLDAVAAQCPDVGFSWVDVEDEEDVVGDLDVETFPTLLIAAGARARFMGALVPQASVLMRLLQSLQSAEPEEGCADAAAQALWERLLAANY